jgi:hypothetical protein
MGGVWGGNTRGIFSKNQKQVDPTVETTGAVTLTIAKLLTGIITGTPNDARAYTLDTGENIEAIGLFGVNDYIDWTVINLSTDADDHTITITASTGHTIIGYSIVPPNREATHTSASAIFRTRKVSSGVYVTYHLA